MCKMEDFGSEMIPLFLTTQNVMSGIKEKG